MKITLYFFIFLLAVFSLYAYFIYTRMLTEFNVKEVHIKDTKVIYLKSFVRGLNYHRLAISISDSRKFDAERDYIYNWDETIFYKLDNDTLYILCSEFAADPAYDSGFGVFIKQVTYRSEERSVGKECVRTCQYWWF